MGCNHTPTSFNQWWSHNRDLLLKFKMASTKTTTTTSSGPITSIATSGPPGGTPGKSASAPPPTSGASKKLAEAAKKAGKKPEAVIPQDPNEVPEMKVNEKERITEVFKMYETGVRAAAMHPKVSELLLLKNSMEK